MTELQFTLPKNFTGRFVSETDIEIGPKEILLLEAYVPGIKLVSGAERFDVTVRHKLSDSQRMKTEGSEITLYNQWSGKFSPDMYHLLWGIARKHYLQNNLFPVHAACVGLDDLVLIAGHSGTGKTTTAMELLDRHGMKLYSGNKTVIDLNDGTLRPVAGTTTITSRSRNAQGEQYGDLTAFKLPADQYIQARDISSVVLVHLNDGVQEWNQLSSTSAFHTLFPYFLDTVKADVVIGQDVFDGSIPLETKEYLARKLIKALQEVPVYAGSGSLPFIVDKIAGVKR